MHRRLLVACSCIVLLCSGPAGPPAFAQPTGPTHAEPRFSGYSLYTEQDFLSWENEDRNYTMGVGLVLGGRVGDVLEKSGRTTSVTRALVTGVGTYPGVSDGFSLAVPPVETEDVEISHDGDSGAIWYDPETGEGVGMLVRGEDLQNPFSEWAIASALDAVLEGLHAELWDGTDR